MEQNREPATLESLEDMAIRSAELDTLPTSSFGREACNDCCCDVGCETYG